MRTYDMQASPRVYPGQTVKARLIADHANNSTVQAALRIKVYGLNDRLFDFEGPSLALAPGESGILNWTLPDLDGQPIQKIGVALTSGDARADGTVFLDYLRWDGVPLVTLRRPKDPSEFWRKSWVNNVSFFSKNFPSAFRISQDRGSGIIVCGTREWTDYRVSSEVAVHLGSSAGLAARVQGLRRYYALQLEAGNKAGLVKMRDDACTVLAEAPCRWTLEKPINLALEVRGADIVGFAGGATLHATDDSCTPFENGGIGLVIAEGALSTDEVHIQPLSEAPVLSERRPSGAEA